MKYCYLLFFLILLTSCSNKKNIEKDMNKNVKVIWTETINLFPSTNEPLYKISKAKIEDKEYLFIKSIYSTGSRMNVIIHKDNLK